MKKIKYILLIFILLLTGCKKNSVAINEFIDVAMFNGYMIEERMDGYEDINSISNVHYAVNRDYAYDIQFIETNDLEYAKKLFLYNVSIVKEELTSEDYIKSNSLTKYEFYHAENESTYYLVARSDKNIIFITAPINYINEIEEFLEELSIDF